MVRGGGESGGPLDWTSIRDGAPSKPSGSEWSRKPSNAASESTGRSSGHQMPRKLCVGAGEADGVTCDAMRSAFGAFGTIERVDLPASKAYSFVEFAERAAASRACAATNNQQMFGKRRLPVSFARSRTGDAPVDSASPKLWVSGIEKGTRKADIKKVFGRFGKVTRVDAPWGKDFAFVWFDRVEDSEMAKRALHNQPIGGSAVRVTYSNKPDGAPVGRLKPVADCTWSARRVVGKPPPTPEDSMLPPTWSDVLTKAKQNRITAAMTFASVWSLWYDDPRSHGEPCVLGTFSTPAEFFEMIVKRVPRVLRAGSRLLLLRAGAPPSPRVAADSGHIMIRVPSRDAPLTWFRLMETMILEDLSFEDTVTGAVLERTGGGQEGGTDSLVLWTNRLVDQVGVQTTQLAMAELRSALKLRADVSVTHQVHEPSSPTNCASSTLAGGDPSWSQLRGGLCTPTAGTASGSKGGRWSPLSSSSTSSTTSNGSLPATPLSTPHFIQRHRSSTQNASNKLDLLATTGLSVENPSIQLRSSHSLRPFGSPEPVVAPTMQESTACSSTAACSRQQQRKTEAGGPLQRPEHLRLKLQKSTLRQLDDSVAASQKLQSQPPQSPKRDPRDKLSAQRNRPCSMQGQAGRLWIAALVAAGFVTVALGLLRYYAPAADLFV